MRRDCVDHFVVWRGIVERRGEDEVQVSSKKPYATPTLTIYGNIHVLTQNTFKKGHHDNPNNPVSPRRT